MDYQWKAYKKTLPLAEKIYFAINEKPKTHAEWVDSLNKIGDINYELYRENKIQ